MAKGLEGEAVRVAIADTPNNEEVIRRWIDAWAPMAETAVASLATAATEASDIRPPPGPP